MEHWKWGISEKALSQIAMHLFAELLNVFMGMATVPCPPLFQVCARYLTFISSPFKFFFKCYSMYSSFRDTFLFKLSILLIISELFIFWPFLPFPPPAPFWCLPSSKLLFHSMRKNNFLFLLGRDSAPLPLCFPLKFFFYELFYCVVSEWLVDIRLSMLILF